MPHTHTSSFVMTHPAVQALPSTLAQVLVVDDEPEIAELLCELLQAAGYGVTIADSGADALRRLRSGGFDAIVSDLRMPDIDGVTLWREVAAFSPRLAQRMLFVTGDTLGAGVQAFLAQTACPSLEKPFRRAELLLRMKEITGDITSD